MALITIDATGAACDVGVAGTDLLAAHFRQQHVQAALEAVVTARTSGRRTVQCSEDSAAAADLLHAEKQGYCALFCSKGRKVGAIPAFCSADGAWPADWDVPSNNPLQEPAPHARLRDLRGLGHEVDQCAV